MNICLYCWYLVSLPLHLTNVFRGSVVLFLDMFLEKAGISINCQTVSGMIIIIKYTKESWRKLEDKMVSEKRLSLGIISTLNYIITQSKWNPPLLLYKYVVLFCDIKSQTVWDCKLSSAILYSRTWKSLELS